MKYKRQDMLKHELYIEIIVDYKNHNSLNWFFKNPLFILNYKCKVLTIYNSSPQTIIGKTGIFTQKFIIYTICIIVIKFIIDLTSNKDY